MAERSRVLGYVVVVGVCIVVIWGWCRFLPLRWCWWCPPKAVDCAECCVSEADKDCPATTEKPRIILDDIHAGVFAHLDNNAWIKGPLGSDRAGTDDDHTLCADTGGDDFGECGGGVSGSWDSYEPWDSTENDFTTYRSGLLFQVGPLLDENGFHVDQFDYVRVTYSGGEVYLSDDGASGPLWAPADAKRSFDWLDINSDRPCPIDAFHAYSLFQNTNVINFECAELEVSCDPALPSCAVTSGVPCCRTDPNSCLRTRQVHGSLDPIAGAITVWPGYQRYWMNATPGDHSDAGYEFNLEDPIVADHWENGCFVTRYEGVVEVEIVYVEPVTGHNEFHEPPMDGGPTGRP